MLNERALASLPPASASRIRRLVSLLERRGLPSFNRSVDEAGFVTGAEISEALAFLRENWDKGEELAAQDASFLSSYTSSEDYLYGTKNRTRRKITPATKRNLSNLFSKEELAEICASRDISSIAELTEVQGQRITSARLRTLMPKGE